MIPKNESRKSKAAMLLEVLRKHDAESHLSAAVKWWNKLTPRMQKDWMKKIPPEEIASVYRNLYGNIPSSTQQEDMSKTKKVIIAAALAAFLLSGTVAKAASFSQQGYDGYQQQRYTQQYDQERRSGPSAKDIANLGKTAIDLYGTTRTQQRADKATQDINFINHAIRVLTGNQ